MTTALFGQLAAEFVTAQYDGGPRTIAFTAPLRVGEDDLVAALWRHAAVGMAADELEDLDAVRELVADQLVNGGLDAVAESLIELSKLRPGTEEYAWLQEVRQFVRGAFTAELGAPEPARLPVQSSRQARLVGVTS